MNAPGPKAQKGGRDSAVNILGFVYGRGCHDTSAAIVCEGKLRAAVEEERFSRVKHDAAFPFRAIEYCLRETGLRMAEIDCIAFPEKPFRTGPDSYVAALGRESVQRLYARGKTSLLNLTHKYALDLVRGWNWGMEATVADGFRQLRERYGELPPVRYYEHHRAHAAAAYFTSGAEAASIVTTDCYGGPFSTVAWKAEGGLIRKLREETWDNSLGQFYYDLTGHLGFQAEGKTMGLAPYGDAARLAELFAEMLETGGADWFRYRGWPEPGPARAADENPLEARWADLAAAGQAALERALARVVGATVAESGCRELLCLGGGVALNCSANGTTLASGVAERVWVFPASGDAGLAVGAALLCAVEQGEPVGDKLERAYWGPDCGRAACEAALRDEARVAVCDVSGSLAETVAQALADGKIVGVCRGRMEFGPRALGNRSILADSRSVEIRDRVNRLKGRELWRPLAPAVPAERAGEFFELRHESPFMLLRANVKTAARALIPGAVHVDGSARPQTVTREQNEFCYELLGRFGEMTGVPVLLNTSFNVVGEPIVCTPGDAIRSFLAAGLDLLVLGDLLVGRRGK